MKTQLPLLCLALLAAAAQAAGPLPQYMVGKYVLETSEGFDNYMWELGVNWFTRKVSALNTAKKLQKLQYINHPLLSTIDRLCALSYRGEQAERGRPDHCGHQLHLQVNLSNLPP